MPTGAMTATGWHFWNPDAPPPGVQDQERLEAMLDRAGKTGPKPPGCGNENGC